MTTPLPYLSFSQIALWERSTEEYARMYLFGEKQHITRNMSFGSKLADGMEKDELSGDPLLDVMMTKLPKYELADKVIEDEKGIDVLNPHDGKTYKVPFLKNGKEKIPLLGKPDSASLDYMKVLEYKTSTRKWTQKMVDESGQLDFYATCIWLKTGKIPNDIELINVQVEYNPDGTLSPTGEMYRFRTIRTMTHIIKTTSRIRKCWKNIKELCEKELI